MLPDEVFRPVEETGGTYLVSNLGRVFSVERVISRKDGVKQFVPAKFLAFGLGGNQRTYYLVTLCVERRRLSRMVHTLVAEAFLGPRPSGLNIRHLDGDSFNNHCDNLCYGTQKQNRADSLVHKKVPS